ncbi:MAG: site-specific integrase [Alteromonadaceae bacterium]
MSKLRKTRQILYIYSLNKHVINTVHANKVFKTPIEDITIKQWFTYFDYIEDHHKPITAKDILVRLKTCFRFCIRRGLITSSPLLDIAPKYAGKGSKNGERVVELDEMKVILKEIDRPKCYQTTGNAIKLFMLTAARLGEVRNMERKDINFKKGLWIVPKDKSKTKILRPLAPKASEIIKYQFETFEDVTECFFPRALIKILYLPKQLINSVEISLKEQRVWKIGQFMILDAHYQQFCQITKFHFMLAKKCWVILCEGFLKFITKVLMRKNNCKHINCGTHLLCPKVLLHK